MFRKLFPRAWLQMVHGANVQMREVSRNILFTARFSFPLFFYGHFPTTYRPLRSIHRIHNPKSMHRCFNASLTSRHCDVTMTMDGVIPANSSLEVSSICCSRSVYSTRKCADYLRFSVLSGHARDPVALLMRLKRKKRRRNR